MPRQGCALMHRVRVGLIGLLSVFLLVMVAAAVLRVTSTVPKADLNTATVLNEAATPSEPLAQLGVAPGYAPPEENAAVAAKPTNRGVRR
jgi:hypothetical protein